MTFCTPSSSLSQHPSSNHDLLTFLKEKVAQNNNICRLDHFMEALLYHPLWGYYTNHPSLEVDFITAPHLTSLFGEILAFSVIDFWQRAGAPRPFRLIELGPGTGRLMADILSLFHRYEARSFSSSSLLSHLSVHLVETSPLLRGRQQESLRLMSQKIPIYFHDHLDEVPPGMSFLVANEFFDAFPIRQWKYRPDISEWFECHVAFDDNGPSCFSFIFLPSPSPLGEDVEDPLDFHKRVHAFPQFSFFYECSPLSLDYAQTIGRRLAKEKGAAVILDYGEKGGFSEGGSLQSVSRHRPVPLLTHLPCDWTAHVNFFSLGKIFQNNGLHLQGPKPQGEFLRDLGILTRRDQCIASLSSEGEKNRLRGAVDRLIHPFLMGNLFKVMGVHPPEMPSLSGF